MRLVCPHCGLSHRVRRDLPLTDMRRVCRCCTDARGHPVAMTEIYESRSAAHIVDGQDLRSLINPMWSALRETLPVMAQVEPPEVIFHHRGASGSGWAFAEKDQVRVCTKESTLVVAIVTLLHELAHKAIGVPVGHEVAYNEGLYATYLRIWGIPINGFSVTGYDLTHRIEEVLAVLLKRQGLPAVLKPLGVVVG